MGWSVGERRRESSRRAADEGWGSVMSWYGGGGGGGKQVGQEREDAGKAPKSWREGCTLGGFEMSPGNATPNKAARTSKGAPCVSARGVERGGSGDARGIVGRERRCERGEARARALEVVEQEG